MKDRPPFRERAARATMELALRVACDPDEDPMDVAAARRAITSVDTRDIIRQIPPPLVAELRAVLAKISGQSRGGQSESPASPEQT